MTKEMRENETYTLSDPSPVALIVVDHRGLDFYRTNGLLSRKGLAGQFLEDEMGTIGPSPVFIIALVFDISIISDLTVACPLTRRTQDTQVRLNGGSRLQDLVYT